MQAIMRQASRDLLDGFELRAECKPNDIVRYPDRFIDKREREDEMQHWNWLMALIEEEGDGQSSNWHGDAAAITIDREKETPTLQSAVGKA